MNEEQKAMLNKLKACCQKNNTTSWVGNQQDLNKIGGRDLLYQLEQDGKVTINRVYEKWIVYPS